MKRCGWVKSPQVFCIWTTSYLYCHVLWPDAWYHCTKSQSYLTESAGFENMKMRFTFAQSLRKTSGLFCFCFSKNFLCMGCFQLKLVCLISASQRSAFASLRPKTNCYFFMLIFTIVLFYGCLIFFVPNSLLYQQIHVFHSRGTDIKGQFKEFLLGLTTFRLTVFTS